MAARQAGQSRAVRRSGLWAGLRDLRYALPERAGRLIAAPDAARAATLSARYHRRGFTATLGYFNRPDEPVDAIVAACRAVAASTGPERGGNCLSIKAPALAFDAQAIRAIAQCAADAGMATMFDAHGAGDAPATLAAAEAVASAGLPTGIVLPARWQRSLADAARFRDSAMCIRIVRGEWPDPAQSAAEQPEEDYLRLVAALAGRAAPVALATHRPALFARAAALLREAGTPVLLEQLRGLPRRRTSRIARRGAVPIRLYIAFGPGWIPYAVDRALARPHLPLWFVRDLIGMADR